MKLYTDSEAAAQEIAERAHDYLMFNDIWYAKSVESGHTKQWDIAHSDGKNGWFINVEQRCLAAFTEKELTRLENVE
tara:strand:- start:9691 stop:9921 length:231 start_codon:yes stop_codon:yes gene_type:complete